MTTLIHTKSAIYSDLRVGSRDRKFIESKIHLVTNLSFTHDETKYRVKTIALAGHSYNTWDRYLIDYNIVDLVEYMDNHCPNTFHDSIIILMLVTTCNKVFKYYRGKYSTKGELYKLDDLTPTEYYIEGTGGDWFDTISTALFTNESIDDNALSLLNILNVSNLDEATGDGISEYVIGSDKINIMPPSKEAAIEFFKEGIRKIHADRESN